MEKKDYSEKMKKLLRTWGVLAVVMLFCGIVIKEISKAFLATFAVFFVFAGIAILLGWDRFVSYGDTEMHSSPTRNDFEEFDDLD